MVLMEERKYTRYEKTRIISARALQISQGAQAMIPAQKEMTPIDIARLEWEKGIIPIDIKRKNNNKT
jgi:DNA-directed RNA polymerase subunit K